jgi:hypothetical protein
MTKYFVETPSGKITVIIADTMKINQKWRAMGGERYGKYLLQFFIGNDLIAEFQDWVGYQIDYGAIYNKGTFEE